MVHQKITCHDIPSSNRVHHNVSQHSILWLPYVHINAVQLISIILSVRSAFAPNTQTQTHNHSHSDPHTNPHTNTHPTTHTQTQTIPWNSSSDCWHAVSRSLKNMDCYVLVVWYPGHRQTRLYGTVWPFGSIR